MKKKISSRIINRSNDCSITDSDVQDPEATRAVMQKKVIRLELNSLQSTVPWIIAGRDFLQGLEEEGIKEGDNLKVET